MAVTVRVEELAVVPLGLKVTVAPPGCPLNESVTASVNDVRLIVTL